MYSLCRPCIWDLYSSLVLVGSCVNHAEISDRLVYVSSGILSPTFLQRGDSQGLRLLRRCCLRRPHADDSHDLRGPDQVPVLHGGLRRARVGRGRPAEGGPPDDGGVRIGVGRQHIVFNSLASQLPAGHLRGLGAPGLPRHPGHWAVVAPPQRQQRGGAVRQPVPAAEEQRAPVLLSATESPALRGRLQAHGPFGVHFQPRLDERLVLVLLRLVLRNGDRLGGRGGGRIGAHRAGQADRRRGRGGKWKAREKTEEGEEGKEGEEGQERQEG
mmetsp:Transcript_9055/g.24645  ORF Transcript_9055/g.24645 Transcript_9055/m.24645 type:complete len:271 (+) Transcript_9055:595-1407(+)